MLYIAWRISRSTHPASFLSFLFFFFFLHNKNGHTRLVVLKTCFHLDKQLHNYVLTRIFALSLHHSTLLLRILCIIPSIFRH